VVLSFFVIKYFRQLLLGVLPLEDIFIVNQQLFILSKENKPLKRYEIVLHTYKQMAPSFDRLVYVVNSL